jgi:hypothetical protein
MKMKIIIKKAVDRQAERNKMYRLIKNKQAKVKN